jgi:hypothetical protein
MKKENRNRFIAGCWTAIFSFLAFSLFASQSLDIKTNMKQFLVLSAIFGMLAGNICRAQTLTVSPSVISNTYTGNITLQISGIPGGDEVTVDKYIDLNGSGVIETNDPLMDTFKITDNGTDGIIGGVTNVNVPVDTDATAGVITTMLNFAPPMTLENMVGHYIYKISNTNGNFTPVTMPFVVTNATTGQSLSGVIYSNGVSPLPYAIVGAEEGTPPNANYLAGAAVADSSGNYQLNLNPGPYILIAVSPGYYFDESLAPAVTLTNDMSVTNNLSLTNGTVSISGTVLGDNAANSNTLGGVMLQFSSGSLTAMAFTDTNGNFSAGVSPNNWKIQLSRERLARRAYAIGTSTLQVNTTLGSVANVTNIAYKGNALLYGSISNNSAAPLANVEFSGNDGNNLYSAKGFSDQNGNYAVAVLGDIPNDTWSVSPASTANALSLANYIENSSSITVIADSQAVQQNFVCLPITASISGQVQENSVGPVAGIGIFASATIDGLTYQSDNVDTGTNGDYTLGVTPGDWFVQFNEYTDFGNNGLENLNLIDLFGPYSVTIPPDNVTLNITLYPAGSSFITSALRLSPTQFVFNVNGSLNVNYTVQVSTNLASPHWSDLQSFQMTTNPFPIVDVQATNSPRFYRVLESQ